MNYGHIICICWDLILLCITTFPLPSKFRSQSILNIDEINIVENESENINENPKDVEMQFIISLMFILGTSSEVQ